jgi:glycosyltransferase involved in cell wall biosynthesis
MKPNSFLEIVVPTFNRSDILSSTLIELTAAISTQTNNLVLRVIDNCSTDDTQSVVEPYLRKGLLKYERNESNIGLVKNIARCINTSKAKWVWVFGDDDHILIHSLPYLLSSLRELPSDTVFARALCAKTSNNGLISFIEKHKHQAKSSIFVYDPGSNIACQGSIHSLAFISQLIINPAHWNQNYHDSIYQDSDLYTFVLTLLNECCNKKAAALNIHIVAATDRGDRSYYTPNMCIARITEYTSYELMAHAQLGRKRANNILSAGRKRLLRHRIASCVKLIANSSYYKINGRDPLTYMSGYDSPYLSDVVIVRCLAIAGKFPYVKPLFKAIYNYLSKSSK